MSSLLIIHNTTFRSGNRELYSVARADLKRAVRKAKAEHRQQIKTHLSSNNPLECLSYLETPNQQSAPTPSQPLHVSSSQPLIIHWSWFSDHHWSLNHIKTYPPPSFDPHQFIYRQSNSAPRTPPSGHWAQVPHKGVCWASCCTLSTPLNADPPTPATPSLSLQLTQRW